VPFIAWWMQRHPEHLDLVHQDRNTIKD